MDVEKHYQRKEHLLFSCLERHGITGPSTVMWGKDDEARGLLKELGTALSGNQCSVGEWRLVTQAVAEPALAAVEEMVFKEERILLPMALQNLTETEWGEIFTQSPQFGYCLVDPRRLRAQTARERRPGRGQRRGRALRIRVRFFSEGQHRVFARPKAILGRLVDLTRERALQGERRLLEYES